MGPGPTPGSWGSIGLYRVFRHTPCEMHTIMELVNEGNS